MPLPANLCNHPSMDWLTFISKLIEFAAWPIAFVSAAFFLRDKLGAIIQAITKVQAGPIAIELSSLRAKVNEAEAKADAALETLSEPDEEGAQVQGDDSMPGPTADLTQATLPAATIRVLQALGESSFSMRSIPGIAREMKMGGAQVEFVLNNLVGNGWAVQTLNSQGKKRFYITPTGRQMLLSSRGKQPTKGAPYGGFE